LVVDFCCTGGGAYSLSSPIIALFQDANVDAINVFTSGGSFGAVGMEGYFQINASFKHVMTAGTILPTTFKIRIGTEGADFWLNGGWDTGLFAGTRKFGGISKTCLTVTEYAS
jgi:hypothetical protein